MLLLAARSYALLPGWNFMTISLTPLLALIAGILILMMPKLLNYIVAFYLIIAGLIGLFGIGAFNLSV